MDIQEIGRMMYTLRTEKEISQEELCRGICSVATLSRLETGERRPDILIFNALFQRMGMSTDHINTLLTLEEFEYFVKRRNVEIALSTKDFEQAEKDLNLLEEELQKKGISLQRQDIYRLHALLYIHKESNYKLAEKVLNEIEKEIDIRKNTQQLGLYNVWKEGNRNNVLISILFGKNEHIARIWENNTVHSILISMEGANK